MAFNVSRSIFCLIYLQNNNVSLSQLFRIAICKCTWVPSIEKHCGIRRREMDLASNHRLAHMSFFFYLTDHACHPNGDSTLGVSKIIVRNP